VAKAINIGSQYQPSSYNGNGNGNGVIIRQQWRNGQWQLMAWRNKLGGQPAK